jgi:DNA replication ATP-dependent helicase Dna2
MEIKTGRSIGGVQHRAQTLLYTLLMEDRYGEWRDERLRVAPLLTPGLPVPAGLLYYSQRDSLVLVEARANEVRALVQTRNELAEWMVRERESADEPFLPRTVDDQRECKNCYASDVCMLYRAANNEAPAFEDDPIGDIFQDKTEHLTPKHAEFFKHWERLLTLEEQDTVRLRAQLWTMGAHARETKGRCFADMVISKEEHEGGALSKINRWVYTFTRADPQAGSLLSGHISRNDPVCLSLEPDLLYLARGFVTLLTADTVTITVQNKLDVETKLKRVRSSAAPIFRIDKDELSSGMVRMRGNLAYLFVKDGDWRRRTLIVDLSVPRFDSTRAPKPYEIPPHLNEDQRGAMTKVLTARDYALVLGMPGTGKTTTIAEIIRAIVARGQSVLLTSYTHSAVDTIVSKLVGADFGVLRLGNVEKVGPSCRLC